MDNWITWLAWFVAVIGFGRPVLAYIGIHLCARGTITERATAELLLEKCGSYVAFTLISTFWWYAVGAAASAYLYYT